MKSWGLNFISEDNFKKHVAATIEKYGENLSRSISNDSIKTLSIRLN